MARERGDIVCLACGRLLGEVEWNGKRLRLVERDVPNQFRLVEKRMVCLRCGGRGFVDHRMLAAS